MNTFILAYLGFTIIWFIVVLIYHATVFIFSVLKVKDFVLILKERLNQASSEQIKEQVRNLGIGIAVSGFFGAFFGITNDTQFFEIVLRSVLAVLFAIVGTIVVILGLSNK